VYVFLISPWIGLLMLVVVPLSVLISTKFGKKIRHYGNERNEKYSGYISYVFEVFTAIRDIRLLGAKPKVFRDIASRQKEMYGVTRRSSVSTITAQKLIDGTNLVVQLSILLLPLGW
jgi:ABC-type bacteriocin/lantibiotic exporter with double-glycine peptidase domain